MKKVTKSSILSLLLVLGMVVSASALPIISVEKELAWGDAAYVTLPPNYGGGVTGYTSYALQLTGGTTLQAFCIEGVDGPSGSGPFLYELFQIDTSHTRELQAAYLANKYLNTSQRGAAQVAIWNLWVDNDNSLSAGSVQSSFSGAQALLDEALGQTPTGGYGWVIAHSPVGPIGNALGYQDYLVQDPVPEPVSMLLFGTGLVAAGGYVRRRFKK